MKDSSKRPVIFGEVLFDCFPDGSEVLGGAAFNVAWHLRGFGEAPLFISRIGKDRAGEQVRAAMTAWGMDTQGLQSDDQHPTGRVCVSLLNNEPRYEIVSAQAYDFIQTSNLPNLQQPAFLYHGSLALRSPTSRETLETVLARHPMPVFLDVNLRSPWWTSAAVHAMMTRATWLKLNVEELNQLAPGKGDLSDRCKDLINRFGLQEVVLTQGSEGAVAVNTHLESQAVRPQSLKRFVDTVGAGDAFASVLMLGHLRGWELPTTLERAQAFASRIVGVRGATVSQADWYRQLLVRWEASKDNQER